MSRYTFLAAAAFALCIGPLVAADFKLKGLVIDHAYARATPPGAEVAGAYLKVRNDGKEADRLVRAASPVAGVVEIHEMYFEQNVMRMRAVPGIEIKPGATITLQPGGYHVMLMGLKRPLAVGDKFPLTVTFEKAGSVEVAVDVEAVSAASHGHKQ